MEEETNGETTEDSFAITHHTIQVGGESLEYTATAGYLPIREEPELSGLSTPPSAANIFVTAYTVAVRDDEPPRPVIFAYNGGPGSTSMWLHLGFFGPRRVIATDGLRPIGPPYALVDNDETPLRYGDVVVVDLVNTGYSRMETDEPADTYHGVTRDVDLTAEVIRLWVTRNQRWNSPVLLAGESYGVLRTAKVAERLISRHGLYPAGLVLISSPIGPDSMDFGPGAVLSYPAFLPSYAAVAHYHGHRPDRTLAEVIDEAEQFAAREYVPLLQAGNRLTDPKLKVAAQRLAQITGLSADYLVRTRLRITNNRFFVELLRSRGQIIGRNDGRFIGWNADTAGELAHSDPAYDVIRGAFASAMNHYVRTELGYINDLPYEVTTARARPWQTDPGQGFSAVDSLGIALRKHPRMLINYSLGYYDLCTPYWGAECDLAQVDIPPELMANIEVQHYASGHMIYLDDSARVEQAKNLEAFVGRVASF